MAARALDLQTLDSLRSDIGQDETTEIVRMFLELLPERLDRLDDPDGSVVHAAAHTLGSTAGLLGAGELARAARALEGGAGSPALVRESALEAGAALQGWLGRIGQT